MPTNQPDQAMSELEASMRDSLTQTFSRKVDEFDDGTVVTSVPMALINQAMPHILAAAKAYGDRQYSAGYSKAKLECEDEYNLA